MAININERTEWLETDGLGGFASGTTCGIRMRRYHGLLLSAASPPTGRYMLVNGMDVSFHTPEGVFPLSLHRYRPGVTTRSEDVTIESFQNDPWPRWVYRLRDGTEIEHELFVTKGTPRTALVWRLRSPQIGARLMVRPLLSGRDYHALHHENPHFRFDPEVNQQTLSWSPYPGVPSIDAAHNGVYRHGPVWYRGFQYDMEQERGVDFIEDLASPGTFEFDVASGEAQLTLAARAPSLPAAPESTVVELRQQERARRTGLGSRLDRAADDYLVRRGDGTTIIAGYPWFADWGRDTFIALRGLCLATGRIDDARRILLAWANTDSRGVLPNRFADAGDTPEYNSVDASLWFVVVAGELIRDCRNAGSPLSTADSDALRTAILRIVHAFAAGTHHGIRLDQDGLLAAGEPGLQLTWMDARVGDRVITPRIGKPVEVQALWLNALKVASQWERRWIRTLELGRDSFDRKFWNDRDQCLYDVVDVDHVAGGVDDSIRPNQILAVGGLPMSLVTGDRARSIVDTVESHLYTPLGLRSLAAGHAQYAPRYTGGPAQRDTAYHQGTVWPWMLGPFVEAWVRVHGDTDEARETARSRFLAPLLTHLDTAGLGHISEIADGDSPHSPNGCPFQAWSVGELLRLDRRVLARKERSRSNRSPAAVIGATAPATAVA